MSFVNHSNVLRVDSCLDPKMNVVNLLHMNIVVINGQVVAFYFSLSISNFNLCNS